MKIIVRHAAVEARDPPAASEWTHNLEARVIHVRREHERAARRAAAQPHDDVAKCVAPKSQAILGTDKFHDGPHPGFVKRRGGT
jgi:hypothetical protein